MNTILHQKSGEEILAIDFGTVNTYFTKCSPDECLPQGVHFSAKKPGLATAILLRKEKAPIAGDIAIEEYTEATVEERKNYNLLTQFKPEIPYSTKAQDIAVNFLATVLSDAQKIKLDISPENKKVIFGAPCSVVNGLNKDYAFTLSDIAKKAGYGNINLVEEPIGALLFHVAMGNMSAADAQKGILVIDFGGGTCDFSLMKKGHIINSWGEQQLGGRLFDDLFFSWFLEKNPKMQNALKKDNREFFTLMIDCKDIKEKFSEIIALDRDANIKRSILNYGALDNINLKSFSERASHYSMSKVFCDYFEKIGVGVEEKFKSNLNLIAYFEETLLLGLKDCNDVDYVILAGGSSLWFFVSDIVKKHIPNAKIIRSDRPYATISEGLSILPALQKKSKEIKYKLQKDFPLFCSGTKNKEGLKPVIENVIDFKLQNISEKLTYEIFEKDVIPIIEQFRETGGKIKTLKDTLTENNQNLNEKIKGIVDESLLELEQELEVVIRQKISKWFAEYKICLSDDQILQKSEGRVPNNVNVGEIDVLYDIINNLLAGIAGVAITVIFSQPLGMILAFVGAFFVVFLGTNVLEKIIDAKVFLPKAVTKTLFSDRKIKKMTKKFSKDIYYSLKNKNKEYIKQAMIDVSNCIDVEIQALNEINTL
ncbi:MAG: Hsp70 family protein [Treponemataceae bacterium]|nr:Hsp70 family protein [Treponemataceae bacterium]